MKTAKRVKIISTSWGAAVVFVGIGLALISPIKEYHPDFFVKVTSASPLYFIAICSISIAVIAFTLQILFFSSEDSTEKIPDITTMMEAGELEVFDNQTAAEQDIKEDIEKATEIYIYTMRGHSFILPDRPFGNLPMLNKTIKCCFADPGTKRNPNPCVFERAKEYPNTTPESYRQDLESDLMKVKEMMKKNTNFECRKHKEEAVFRFFIFDNHVYFSFFKPHISGSQLRIFRANNDSDIYIGLKRFFDKQWKKSKII